MSGFAERVTQQGEAKAITRLLERRFRPLPEEGHRRIASADAETLLEWSERVLTARSFEEVLYRPFPPPGSHRGGAGEGRTHARVSW